LRESPLGVHLAAVDHYLQGDLRTSLTFIARCLYSDTLSTSGFRLPLKWQRIPLGKLCHTDLLRFFEEELPDRLLAVADMRKRFGVKRQTVHQWIEDGLIFAVYRGDTPLFYRNDVNRHQQLRAHKQREGNFCVSYSCKFNLSVAWARESV
jgi:hypothetical protein